MLDNVYRLITPDQLGTILALFSRPSHVLFLDLSNICLCTLTAINTADTTANWTGMHPHYYCYYYNYFLNSAATATTTATTAITIPITATAVLVESCDTTIIAVLLLLL